MAVFSLPFVVQTKRSDLDDNGAFQVTRMKYSAAETNTFPARRVNSKNFFAELKRRDLSMMLFGLNCAREMLRIREG